MQSLEKIKKYLDNNSIEYEQIHHTPTYTAEQLAHKLQIPLKYVAKCVIVKSNNKYSLVVIPGDRKVNTEYLKSVMSENEVDIASESEFISLFPDCETGAMSPFGNLYKLPVYVGLSLLSDEDIVFNAGTHEDAIKMKYDDFDKLVHPKVAFISTKVH